MATAIRTCALCEATCGLRLTLDGNTVVRVVGDEHDVFSAGYLCPKGALIGEVHADPDRLTRPRVRRDGGWVEVDWEEAFDEIGRRLAPILTEHGRDAVGVYLGNPNVHNLAGQLYVRPLLKALGTRQVFSASSVDQLPKHLSCGAMFGDPLAVPVPDIDRTDLLVVLGGNPRVSNGSLWTAPNLPGRLDALRRRGGRLVVVDPRRTRTAARADRHLAVRPGTDALLLAAVANVLLAEGLVDGEVLNSPRVTGLDALRGRLSPFTPQVVSPRVGIPAEAVRELARELAAAGRACVYGRLGTTTVRHGTVTSWLVDVVNLLTGNLDRPGGAMFAAPAHHRPTRRPFTAGRWRSRVRGLPEVIGELPVATLADEIETPGDGQLRALFVLAGNPVISSPDAGRLDAAIAGLDLVVAVDTHVTATARHATVLLPPPSVLERSHYDLTFTGFAVRNVANYSPATFAPPAGQLDEWQILLGLAAVVLGQRPPLDLAAADAFVAHQLAEQLVTDPSARVAQRDPQALLAAVGDRVGPERLLDLLLRAGRSGDGFGQDPDGLTLADLEAAPHGVDLGPLQPRLDEVVNTASGRVEVLPDLLVPGIEALADELAAPSTDGLVLIGRRHLRTNNSWSHNVAGLRGGSLCTLQVSPADAAREGLVDGGRATVRSRVGELVARVEVTDDLREGVVSLPHGFGSDLDGVELTEARRGNGVNSNLLTDAAELDVLSGTAVLNGIPVDVTPATDDTPSAGATPATGRGHERRAPVRS
ncbi:molybdopterin-dependent oxidoreductase [Egicoccus halophilus]|uniref:Molybdopterin-binding oxidoreductase n=1 Tax=Egicoccus halophilus TaxID=1670830 RepID=A0A8J3ERL0_9ACTN|nr:molybdopterin-dependent oxidoreductase [Egicoccus halophilus]GGI05170.1 molybdopterin-binding oxidoreductase [Egicoccus halophilus]